MGTIVWRLERSTAVQRRSHFVSQSGRRDSKPVLRGRNHAAYKLVGSEGAISLYAVQPIHDPGYIAAFGMKQATLPMEGKCEESDEVGEGEAKSGLRG